MILVIVVVAAPVCLVLATRTRWGRERMRDLAVQAIRDELGLVATLSNPTVEADPLSLSLVVSAEDIVLDDPVYGRFAEADALRIRPSLVAVALGQIDLQTIEIDRPSVRLVLADGEIRNLPRTRGSVEGGELPFQRLVVNDATLVLDASPHAELALEEVDLEMDVEHGDEVELTASSSRGVARHVRGEERIERFLVRARIEPEGLLAHQVVVRSPHVRFEAREAAIPIPWDDARYRGQVDFRVRLGYLDRLPHGWELPALAGRLRLSGEVRGSARGPRAHGRIEIDDGVIERRYGLGDIALDVAVDREGLRIESGTAEIIGEGGRVAISGTIGFGDGFPTDMTWEVERLQFARLMEQIGVAENPIVRWDMAGTIVLRGTLDPLEIGGPITVRSRDFLVTQDAWHVRPERRVVGVSRARLVGTTRTTERGIHFQRVRVDTPSSRLFADALICFDDTIVLDVSTTDLDAADASPLVDIQIGGHGSAEVQMRGEMSDPILTGSFRLDDFTFNDYRWGDIESTIALEEHAMAVRFPEVRAEKNDSRYRVENLFLDFRDHRFIATGRVQAQRLELADIYHLFRYEQDERFQSYQGVTRGTIDVQYTLGFPGDDAQGTMLLGLDLELPEANFAGYAFTDGALLADLRWLDWDRGYEGAELTVQHLTLRKGEGTLTVGGRMGLGGALQLTATADQLRLAETEGLGDRIDDLDGVLGFVADVGGTLEVPRVNFDMGFTGVSYGQSLLGDARVYVRLTDTEDPWVREARGWDPRSPPADQPCAHARAGLAHGRWPPDPPVMTVEGPRQSLPRPMAYLICGEGLGGQLAVDLAVGWTETYPLRGRVRLNGVDLAPILAQDSATEQLGGSVTGDLYFAGGGLLSPETLDGQVTFTELRVGTSDVEIRNRRTVDVRFEDGAFRVARGLFIGPSSRIRVRGGGSFARGLDLRLEGRIDMGLISTLSPRVHRAEGQLELTVDVNGPIAEPRIFGEAIVRDGGFLYASFPEPVSEMNGRITFNSHRVSFEEFQAHFAGGTLALQGAATLRGRGIEHYELDLTARDVTLAPEDGVEVGLGGQARLQWTEGEDLPTLRGIARISRLAYTRPFALSPTLGELYRARREEVEDYDPEDDLLRLDVRIENEAPLRVANNLVEAEVDIDDSERPFRVVGTDQRFGVLGNLEVQRGILRFRNADFDVVNGSIDFDDPVRINPSFDLQAVTEVRRQSEVTGPDWRIELHAQGSLDAFRLDASSVPELSQEDLMLLLTVGMTRAEAEQLQAGDVTSAAALEALTYATGVDREVQRALPVIDDFSITSVYSTRTNRTEPHIAIGKRISERVRLTASTGLGAEERDVRTGVEIDVGDQTRFDVSYDNLNNERSSFGNVGVDIRWRLEFE